MLVVICMHYGSLATTLYLLYTKEEPTDPDDSIFFNNARINARTTIISTITSRNILNCKYFIDIKDINSHSVF